ncbi:superoxide dismutase [Sphingomonas sp. dw_22]|uniref:superoxide dismutase n=1 Tax=Sphingomonas sp. dw_22 TaxID=2721175 RepID=UPI001BD5EEF6|nr:superoxide dismutase [Sphingomonas sp. dw_22]
MAFELPELPYAKDALAPHMSAETLDFHYGKHHKAYVDNANKLVADIPELAGAKLTDVIKYAKEKGNKGLFNNSSQIWNHSFFWQCLSPEKQAPTGKLAELIAEGFGSQEALVEKLKAESVGHFASGWGWLVLEDGKLKVTSFHDGDSPVAHGVTPLLTIDVWEHAYYIDYRNARPVFVDTLLNNLVNWEFVAQNLDGEGASRADQG